MIEPTNLAIKIVQEIRERDIILREKLDKRDWLVIEGQIRENIREALRRWKLK